MGSAEWARDLLLAVLLALLAPAALAIDPLPFADDHEQRRFRALITELRCVVCQSESLAESNAPLAQDMRQLVFQKMQEGLSDAEIKAFLVDRYGPFVLFRPPLNRNTLVLWAGPPLILLIGAVAVALVIRRRSRMAGSRDSIPSEDPW